MTRRVLDGFRKAALVVCDSRTIRDELIAHDLIAPERVRVVPLGVHPSCTVEFDSSADVRAKHLLNGAAESPINLLHVGSTVERKRIDVLLEVMASVRREFPAARLIRVGGPFTPAQREMVRRFKLEDAVVVLPFLERDVLAAIYRRATLVLQPSEREGFGLPVIESLACGVPVVASDLPVLREVGGDAVAYCKVGELASWTDTLIRLLAEKSQRPEQWEQRRAAGIKQASGFSWAEYARKMVAVYQELIG
ncbi:MAG: glycosyltransferase family 1 protein [Acidobacteria bacterium]|nr:MAG: glycosyltransferase family 1 protein [Acidobacteriota bacterium]